MRCSSPSDTWQEVSATVARSATGVARNVNSRVEWSEPIPAADSGAEHDEVPSARQGGRWNDHRRGAQGRCPPLAGRPVIVDEGGGRDAVVRRIGEGHVQGVARHLDRCHPRPGAELDGLRRRADVVEAQVLGPTGERVQRPVLDDVSLAREATLPSVRAGPQGRVPVRKPKGDLFRHVATKERAPDARWINWR